MPTVILASGVVPRKYRGAEFKSPSPSPVDSWVTRLQEDAGSEEYDDEEQLAGDTGHDESYRQQPLSSSGLAGLWDKVACI